MSGSEGPADKAARHLLHVGFPKTGSTFLQHWCAAHPDLAYRPWGIGGYADAFDLAAEAARGPEAAAWRVTSFELLACPLTLAADFDCARGLDLVPRPGSARRVRELLASLFPDAHVLLVTRGYRSLLRSLHSELVRGGATSTVAEFAEGQAELARRGLSPFDYDRAIGGYEAAFGADKVIVLPFEMLAADPADFLRRLERRLAIRPGPVPDETRPALSPAELYWCRRLNRAILALPAPRRLRRKIFAAHVHNARRNRPRQLLGALARIRPAARDSGDIAEAAVAAFRGTAERLRGRPLYASYAREYLLDG